MPVPGAGAHPGDNAVHKRARPEDDDEEATPLESLRLHAAAAQQHLGGLRAMVQQRLDVQGQQPDAPGQDEQRAGAQSVLRALLEQQGAAASLLRSLVLQERAVAALLSAEEQLQVWQEMRHVRAAWDGLTALFNADAAVKAEADDQPAPGPHDEEPEGSLQGGSGGANAAEQAQQGTQQQQEEAVSLAEQQQLQQREEGPPLRGGGRGAAPGAAAAAAPVASPQRPVQGGGSAAQGGVVIFRWNTNYKLKTCLLLPPSPTSPSSPRHHSPSKPAHKQQRADATASISNSSIRGAGASSAAPAPLPLQAAAPASAAVEQAGEGSEREVPYYAGMERSLEERFRVKFLAWSTAGDKPPSPPLPPASFLFLQRGARDEALTLLGVVEAATLVQSSNPNLRPHVYVLQVRRVVSAAPVGPAPAGGAARRGDASHSAAPVKEEDEEEAPPGGGGNGGSGGSGIGGSGAALRRTLCKFFGMSEDEAKRVQVKRCWEGSSSPHVKDVLWLPGGTPRLPCPLS